MNAQQQQQQPTDVYTVFAGNIDQDAAGRISRGIALATQNNVKTFHLLLQSTGGFIADGIFLYNFIQSCSINVALYNAGSIQSIAAVVFLGAKVRKTSAYATFMLHRAYMSPQAATTDRLKSVVQALLVDEQRLEAVLNKHVKIPADKLETHKHSDIWFTAKEAVECGLATEVGDFSPPTGAPIYSL